MIRVGIFFGGPSREREIAFAGGRTVYDNLDKSLFEPVPLFIDSHKRLIHLAWPYIYKGTIRDFFPPATCLPDSPNAFQIYAESLPKLSEEEWDKLILEVGTPLKWGDLPELIDFGFLSLHGEFGEDGKIQGLLESLNIPYSGSGIRASAIGMDKAYQKKLMRAGGFASPEVLLIQKNDWKTGDAEEYFSKALQTVGSPLVIRPANQGSSIGVSIIDAEKGAPAFIQAVDKAFFRRRVQAAEWRFLALSEKVDRVRIWTDIREGVGFPMNVSFEADQKTLYHPEELLQYLNEKLQADTAEVILESWWTEQQVVVEGFIKGKEFSCIVVRNLDGSGTALPPTEIIKGGEVFDYRSKYLPGMSRKETPIHLPDDQIQAIRKECERLFHYFEFNTYARIDGFITEEEEIFLNDPNTTSGMLPSSFFFHQAAEIGLNPSQFLTFIIYVSLQERIRHSLDHPPFLRTLEQLDARLEQEQKGTSDKKKIAVILGGYSFERHISVESGRNIFEKLSSSDKYEPIPVFLSGDDEQHQLFQLPINLLLKDNADDIRDKIKNFRKHSVIEQIKDQCAGITRKFASREVVFSPQPVTYEQLAQRVDGVFIGLHGRPGEDGKVQQELERVGLPYNGSGPDSSSITINKYETLRILREAGFTVADQMLVGKKSFLENRDRILEEIWKRFSLPLVAKPVDDGCSSAVKVVRYREQLVNYLEAMFREEDELSEALRERVGLHVKEEFPKKEVALLETLVTAEGAQQFMEITVGLRTFYHNGALNYCIFEPSEALAGGEVLSLEEKFLAGEGQNITPARLGRDRKAYREIAEQVKADIEKAARLLGVKGYARIDAFVRVFEGNRSETIIIEVNSLPGMTPATCIFHQAALEGMKPYEFIDQILEFGFYERTATQPLE
jgi:UDP-N-acetylmuramate--alanine ligase